MRLCRKIARVSLVDVADRMRYWASIYFAGHIEIIGATRVSSIRRDSRQFGNIGISDTSSSGPVTGVFVLRLVGGYNTSPWVGKAEGPKAVLEFGGGWSCWVLFHVRVKFQDCFYNASEIP